MCKIENSFLFRTWDSAYPRSYNKGWSFIWQQISIRTSRNKHEFSRLFRNCGYSISSLLQLIATVTTRVLYDTPVTIPLWPDMSPDNRFKVRSTSWLNNSPKKFISNYICYSQEDINLNMTWIKISRQKNRNWLNKLFYFPKWYKNYLMFIRCYIFNVII